MRQEILVEPYNPKWPLKYQEEKEKIYNALGFCTNGGALYKIEHIGSTSITNLAAKPCIDVIAEVFPFPLSDEKIRALKRIGFEYHGENGIAGRDYFTKGKHELHLHVFAFGSEHWSRHILFRDYLRANAEARAQYQTLKLELAKQFKDDRVKYQNGKAELIGRLEQNALEWHIKETAFNPIIKIAEELKDLPCNWAIASGWAIDMFLGKPNRYHDDIDIVIARKDQLCLQKRLLRNNWQLDYVMPGRTFPKYRKWNVGEIVDSISNQIHARKDGLFLDIMLEQPSEDLWLYRRDNSILMPISETICYFENIPYRVAEINLLYKARANRLKDKQDFNAAFPKLSKKSKQWLLRNVKKLDENHSWLSKT